MHLEFKNIPCGIPPFNLYYFPYFYGPRSLFREQWVTQFLFIQSHEISVVQTPQFCLPLHSHYVPNPL